MPAIRSQRTDIISVDHATLTLDTQYYGLLFVDVLRTSGPTRITITEFQDGVQRGQVVLSNPPAATLEAQIDAAVTSLLQGGFQFRSHLVSVSPLLITVGCFLAGYVIPANWWQPPDPGFKPPPP